MQYEPTNGHSLWPITLKDCVEEPPEVPAFGIRRQEGHKFQASLECVVKQGLGKKKKCKNQNKNTKNKNNNLYKKRTNTQSTLKKIIYG